VRQAFKDAPVVKHEPGMYKEHEVGMVSEMGERTYGEGVVGRTSGRSRGQRLDSEHANDMLISAR
jgi:hypothetical protein